MGSFLKKLYPAEGLTLFYILLTGLYILLWPGAAADGTLPKLLGVRLFVVLAIILLSWLPVTKLTALLRQFWLLAFILYWYPETYDIHSCLFGNLDDFLIHLDAISFGCQPSLEFSRVMPWYWMNELMNFAYLSYYFIIAGTVISLYIKDAATGFKAVTVLLCSFFLYYILFILLPAEGPQFYLPSPDNATPYTKPFRAIMRFLQETGEKPTGAFPSSHVGITVICMMILWLNNGRKLFWCLLPLAILLIASTVYIKAHYLVDVIAGLLTAPLCYRISLYLYKFKNSFI